MQSLYRIYSTKFLYLFLYIDWQKNTQFLLPVFIGCCFTSAQFPLMVQKKFFVDSVQDLCSGPGARERADWRQRLLWDCVEKFTESSLPTFNSFQRGRYRLFHVFVVVMEILDLFSESEYSAQLANNNWLSTLKRLIASLLVLVYRLNQGCKAYSRL